jgi:hypothetical protein
MHRLRIPFLGEGDQLLFQYTVPKRLVPFVSKLRFRYRPPDRELIAYADVVYVDEFNCQGGTIAHLL